MKNNRYTFMVSILILFGALTIFLSLFLISNFYTRGLSQSYKMLEEKNIEVSNNLANTIMESLKSVVIQLNVLSKVTDDKNIILNETIISKVMWEQLKSDENIASIFLADEYGNFLQTRREPALAFRVLNKIDKSDLDVWSYKDKDFNTISIDTKNSKYDPRKRDWYKLVNKNTAFWSEPYIFDSTGESGITISVGDFTAKNSKIKVAAADFTLSRISEMLKEKENVLNGKLIIFNERKDIIGTSFNLDLKTKDNKVLKLDNLESSIYLDVFSKVMQNSFTGELTDKDKKEYIYFISELEKNSGDKWYIASFVEKDVITADIRNTLIKTVLISLLIIIIIYFPIQYLLQRFVTKPIRELENLTKEIAQNKYKNIEPIKTI
uniref:PDC sensor domain-containing protein n=1 Tax=Aliarcobacter sp. TaxID=2321116 RepID=UPI004047A8DF